MLKPIKLIKFTLDMPVKMFHYQKRKKKEKHLCVIYCYVVGDASKKKKKTKSKFSDSLQYMIFVLFVAILAIYHVTLLLVVRENKQTIYCYQYK